MPTEALAERNLSNMADHLAREQGSSLTGYNSNYFHTWNHDSPSDLPSTEGVGMDMSHHENEAQL